MTDGNLKNAARFPSVYRIANAVRPLGRNSRNDPCTKQQQRYQHRLVNIINETAKNIAAVDVWC